MNIMLFENSNCHTPPNSKEQADELCVESLQYFSPESTLDDKNSVTEQVLLRLAVMRKHTLHLADSTTTDPVSALMSTPRTGKAARFANFDLQLDVRSVFDHIVSLGRNADIFLSHTKHSVMRDLLADCIVFHDLNEVIVGDIPTFTSHHLAGNMFHTEEMKYEKELNADRELERLLGELEIGGLFKRTMRSLYHNKFAKRSSVEATSLYFRMLDKSDPIIAIWRYINLYRTHLDIDIFLRATIDFFINPAVAKIVQHDLFISSLVAHLQDPVNAVQYYSDPAYVYSLANSIDVDVTYLEQLFDPTMNMVHKARRLCEVTSITYDMD